MSRPAVLGALLALAALGLAPIAVMLVRVDCADLTRIVDARTLDLLGRTLTLGLSVAALAGVLGFGFGYLCARTDLPGAAWLGPLGLAPLLLPPLFLAMTWTAVLPDLRGATASVLILGAGTFPLVSLFTAKAATRIDRRSVEAAQLVGGGRSVFAMELPLLLPAVGCGAALAFVFAINDFAVPDYVSSVGPKFNVYADEVFSKWQSYEEPGRAVASGLPLVLLSLAFLWPTLALRRRGALASFSGDFLRPPKLALGPWRWPLFALALALIALSALVPLARLVWEAGGGLSGFAPGKLHAAFARALELGRDNLRYSLLTASAAAFLCLPIGLILGHAIERARRGRWLEPLTILPFAVPAILFSIGSVVVWNRAPERLYASGAMVVALFAGRFLVFPILANSGSVAALDPKLEEAAQLAGAPALRRLLHIVIPAVWPALLGSWVMVFVLSMRELDAAILAPAANRTFMFKVFNAVHFGRDDFVAAQALLAVLFIVLPALAWSLLGRRRLEILP